jgi:hypothetical protein
MMWSAAIALVALLAIGGALWLWGLNRMGGSAAIAGGQAAVPVVEKRVVSRFASPTEEAAVNLVKQAILIRDPGKVSEYFRLGSASPEAVVGFLRGMETVTGYTWLSSMDTNGLLLEGVAVKTKAEDRVGNRLAIMTPDEKGKWKVDFDAFARTVKPAWSEIMAMTTGQGLVRVMFTKDNYFNGPFREDAQWSCYRLGSSDLDATLLGYCRKGSPQAAAMARVLAHVEKSAKGGSLKRATLEIRRVEGAESRQFEITRVLAEDWVMSATPVD